MSYLGSEQVVAYRRQGFLSAIPALSPEDVSRARAEFDRLYDHLGRPSRIAYTHLSFLWSYRLVHRPALLDVVESLLGDEILVESVNILSKPPRTADYAPWHQDTRIAQCLDPDQIFTAWIALSPSTPESGCLRAIPGIPSTIATHELTPDDEDNFLLERSEIAMAVDESRACDLMLRPGEMSLHDSRVVHGSGPNSSAQVRIGFGIHFTTPELPASRLPVLQVRGEHPLDHLEVWRQPPPSDFATGLEQHSRLSATYD